MLVGSDRSKTPHSITTHNHDKNSATPCREATPMRSLNLLHRLLFLIIASIIASLVMAIAARGQTAHSAPLGGFFTNEAVIAGLNDRSIDLSDSLEVFRRVI